MSGASVSVVAAREPAAAEAHLLPCEVQYSGPAPVSAYFKPSPLPDQGTHGAAFRGRKLLGRTVALPEGYTGTVLQDTNTASIADGEERKWLQKGTFNSLTYWNHDDQPSGDEPLFKAMQLAGLASALHGHCEEAPISPEAV